MSLFGELCLLLPLLGVCSFFPGFCVVRRLRWTPLEKLCGSVGLSLILLYLAAWATYCFGPHDQRPVYRGIVAVAALSGVVCRRDTLRLFRTFRVRQAALAFTALLAFAFALLAMIRVYSGAGWGGDWQEHLQRALFFLDRLPPATKIYALYLVPARPPLENVLGALFLGATSDRFEFFQAIFTFFNALLFIACLLLMPALGMGRRRRVLQLLVLAAANPMLMENTVYPWTKSLTAFFVVLGFALYLAGWRKNDPVRTSAAFLALAAGTLAHYSAGPYLLFLSLHCAVRILRAKPVRRRQLALAGVPAALLLATWFGWSLHTYGTKTTLSSNTSVQSANPDPVENLKKVVANIYDTTVPPILRNDTPGWPQPNRGGELRDEAFVFYQLNVVFALGVLGGPLVVVLLCRRFLRAGGRELAFWRALVPFCVVVGIAVVGERDRFGVAHLTLPALEAIGVTFLAAAFPRFGRGLQMAVVGACCVDFGLGVYWQARIESLENTTRQTVYREFVNDGFVRLADPTPLSLGDGAWQNWAAKHHWAMYSRLLREMPRGHESDPQFQQEWRQLEPMLRDGLNDYVVNWGSWPARHDGVFRYIGDWAAGESGAGTEVASGIAILLFASGALLLIRQWAVAPAAAAAAPVARRKKARR